MPNYFLHAFKAACLALTLTLISSGLSAAPFTGPVSPFYLDNWAVGRVYVVQKTSVINSFPTVYSQTDMPNVDEGNLAVTNVVTTNGLGSKDLYLGTGTAGQYNLNGGQTVPAVSHTFQPTPGFSSELQPDGTSDGTYNYTIQYLSLGETASNTENVIRTDLNWQNPTVLFSVTAGYDGIAYDPKNNSLWLADWDLPGITDTTLGGSKITGFYVSNPLSALGFDPADGTLWGSYDQSSILMNWSTDGALLQYGTIVGMPTGTYFAGDFSETAGPGSTRVPEPFSVALLSIGLIGLGWSRRRKT